VIAQVLCIALTAYWAILFLRIILSFTTQFWSPPPYLGAAVKVIYDLTEPVLGPLRRLIPPVGGLDFSPIVVFIAIRVAQSQLC
jgi:YggT family protein